VTAPEQQQQAAMANGHQDALLQAASVRADIQGLYALLANVESFFVYQGLIRRLPAAVLEDAALRLDALSAMVRGQIE
jgi:hypothetical protein